MRISNLHDVHTAGSRRVLGGFSESSRRFSSILFVVRSVDFFPRLFVGFERVSFRIFGSMVSSFKAEDNSEKSNCRGGTPEILQNVE